MEWFISHRPELARNVASIDETGVGQRRLLSIVSRDRLARILTTMLDENEFLSPYGLRALSRYHKEHPFVLRMDGQEYRVDYEPAESTSGLFGGNSNWRGPVWYPLNFLLIEALQKFHYYYGSTLKSDIPNRQRQYVRSVGSEHRCFPIGLSTSSFRMRTAIVPCSAASRNSTADPYWRDNVLFYEYFHGDNNDGCQP